MPADLEAAWNELHDAKPDGWFVGTPEAIGRSRSRSCGRRCRRTSQSREWQLPTFVTYAIAVASRDLAMSQRPTASPVERSSRRQSACDIGYTYR